jgi:hypothetical protein
MAFIQKKINVRGEFAKDDSLDALNMATMPWYAMVILEDHVMVLHSG